MQGYFHREVEYLVRRVRLLNAYRKRVITAVLTPVVGITEFVLSHSHNTPQHYLTTALQLDRSPVTVTASVGNESNEVYSSYSSSHQFRSDTRLQKPKALRGKDDALRFFTTSPKPWLH